MRLLFIAADPMEFPGILAHAEQPQDGRVAVDWSRSARLGAHNIMLVANGLGPKRAAAAVDAAAQAFRPDAVVSTGFCGALLPALEIADVVVGTCIASDDGNYVTLPLKSRHSGPVRSINHIVQTASEKRQLAATGAIAVEMEAAGVASRCESLGLPVYCVKAVTDLAGEDMTNDFNKALRSDGHFATMLILRGSFRNPLVRLPELIRLRRRCVRAARVLGDFFADCRF